MRRLNITEKTETRPQAIPNRDIERCYQSIVNQLVNSISKDVLLRTSYVEYQQQNSTQPTQYGKDGSMKKGLRAVLGMFIRRESSQESDRDAELSGDSVSIEPGQIDLSGESMPV